MVPRRTNYSRNMTEFSAKACDNTEWVDDGCLRVPDAKESVTRVVRYISLSEAMVVHFHQVMSGVVQNEVWT